MTPPEFRIFAGMESEDAVLEVNNSFAELWLSAMQAGGQGLSMLRSLMVDVKAYQAGDIEDS